MRARFDLRWTAVIFSTILALAPSALAAQIAVANHDVNLRPTASSHQPPIRAILAGDTLTLLAPDTTNGYLHVQTRSDHKAGYVYKTYVDVVTGPAVVTPPPPPSTAVTSAPANYHSCAKAGKNNSGHTPAASIQALNLLKNRTTAPTAADIDPAITLDAMLAPGDDHGRFDPSKGADLEGYITDVMVGGVETTNCEATDPLYRDSHIRIARTANAPETERIVVEVTPRWRAAMAAASVDWTTANLSATLVGKKVRVRGWMLFDAEHANAAENTAPGHAGNWRATVWELHPVTVIEILP